MHGITEREILNFISFLIGIYIADKHGGPIVDAWVNSLDLRAVRPPSNLASREPEWRDALMTEGSGNGGALLGRLERLAFVGAYPLLGRNSHLLIGGWLAFKIAAKWEAWKNIPQFPDKFTDPPNTLDELRARNEIGSITLSRFLIGTLGNILVGYFSFFLAKGLVVSAAALILWAFQ
jgi:hypothetical protein